MHACDSLSISKQGRNESVESLRTVMTAGCVSRSTFLKWERLRGWILDLVKTLAASAPLQQLARFEVTLLDAGANCLEVKEEGLKRCGGASDGFGFFIRRERISSEAPVVTTATLNAAVDIGSVGMGGTVRETLAR